MLPSKTSFIDHVRWLRRAANALGAQVIVELDSMRAFVRHGDRHWVLHPRFSTEVDGVPRFFAQFDDEAEHVTGWAPVQPPVWPTARDKLIFKRAARRLGLPVPDFSIEDGAALGAVMVKRAVDVFGQHVHGPYRASAERAIRLEEGEFYERYVPGRALKVWYWDSRPVALERDSAPSVVGDGQSTLRVLIENRVRMRPRITPPRLERILSRCATLLQFDGSTLDAVLPRGQPIRVEFRHGSEASTLSDRETIDLREDADPQWQLLRDAGPALTRLLPEAVARGAMFTVDAVQAPDGRIWLLQMSAHPVVHPLMYHPLIESLISAPVATPVTPSEAH